MCAIPDLLLASLMCLCALADRKERDVTDKKDRDSKRKKSKKRKVLPHNNHKEFCLNFL